MKKSARGRWTPSLWASKKPFGIGEVRPNNYLEIGRALWENRDRLGYAWRILKQGVCDGCALGTSGLRDWTIEGVHLCNVRLRLLRLNTMSALDPARLANVGMLAGYSGAELRALGRLPCPMLRRAGEPGFRPVSWDEALDLIAARIRATQPDRTAYYLTSRGICNEGYYAAQKAVRAMGTNSIDNAARVCHSPSTLALKSALGVAATTCSYSDWMDADLIVFIGSNVANNQPVAMKYLHYAKKAGARVAVVNTYREPGMERYWVPSILESALFGTRIADRFFLVRIGGDIAFLCGVTKQLIERDQLDKNFIERHTTGFTELAAELRTQSWADLESGSGCTREEMAALAEMVGDSRKAIFVWSMGITQHEHGEENVRAIVNLALTKGFMGREGCGLMPIRGHSGVQGGAEMGAYASAFPGGLPINEQNARRFSQLWGFEVPTRPGLTGPEMIDAAYSGDLDLLFSVGGNFLDVLPDPEHVRQALGRVPLRVHMDIVPSTQMLVDATEAVLLLPAATRYETAGGVTETTTERRVIFSPEIPGSQIAEARPEWMVFTDLAQRVRPELSAPLHFEGTPAIRAEIARAIPFYEGIQRLEKAGDQFQYGGPHLCADWIFPTPDGKAHFAAVRAPRGEISPELFRIATRRGKQFNSMVQQDTDGLTGAARDAIFISAVDAQRLGLSTGERVLLRSAQGQLQGRAFISEIKPGNLEAHWPESAVLLDRQRRSPLSGMPDYNAVVHLEKIDRS
jgi:molybdopterin-dependent oxidoreductase alpha subunit